MTTAKPHVVTCNSVSLGTHSISFFVCIFISFNSDAFRLLATWANDRCNIHKPILTQSIQLTATALFSLVSIRLVLDDGLLQRSTRAWLSASLFPLDFIQFAYCSDIFRSYESIQKGTAMLIINQLNKSDKKDAKEQQMLYHKCIVKRDTLKCWCTSGIKVVLVNENGEKTWTWITLETSVDQWVARIATVIIVWLHSYWHRIHSLGDRHVARDRAT